jgi:Protein of unknown function (DUF732)
MPLVVLDSAVASRRANGGARRAGIVGLAVLAAIALGAAPVANAAAPVRGQRAFLADIRAAGLGNSYGGLEALDQGWDMCGLMDSGLSRRKMVSQFAALNPGLGPDGAAQVVAIAIRDLCPWHG